MSVLNENTIIGASAAGEYEIEQSLRFDDGRTTNLSRTPSTASNRKTFTWSGWVKRSNIVDGGVWGVGTGGSSYFNIRFQPDYISVLEESSALKISLRTTQLLRDSSAWYHILLAIDTTQSTASNRAKLYLNGNQVTSFSTETYPSQNIDLLPNSVTPHYLGRIGNAGIYLDGYLAEVNLIDGQALTPDSFGETGDYGEWKPIKYAGTYGTNGFYLNFKNSGSLGNDAAGSNNWTPNNLAATDQMVDSPTNNFCTWNPLDKRGSGATLSEGNLKFKNNSGTSTRGTIASQADGKIYFEVYNPTLVSNTNVHHMGLGSIGLDINNASNMETAAGGGAVVWTYANANGRSIYARQNGSNVAAVALPNAIAAGDIIAFASDSSTGKVWMSQNNSWLKANGSFDGSNALSDSNYLFQLATGHELTPLTMPVGNYVGVLNCGQDSSFAGAKTPQGNQDSNGIGDFFYPVPSGFLSLCTKSLPDVDVIPSEHFNTVIYSGTGSDNRVLSGVGFTPDLGIFKRRNGSGPPQFFDTLRGASQQLRSDTTSAESTQANKQKTFTSDGYTLGTDAQINGSGGTYVAWNWKAGGSASSNTNGSITSQVSANPSAGFSIVSYTGTGSAATVGHGLSKKPSMTWIKPRNFSDNWIVTYDSVDGSDDQAYLNLTNSGGSPSTQYTVAQNATTLGLTNWNNVNDANDTYIAYCFNSVDSYSRVGSYIGNGSADGPFVNLGFKAKFIMIKEVVVGSGNGEWQIFDTARNPINVANNLIAASTTGAESVGNTYQMLDILSNGFKLRSPTLASQINMATTYIYLAFAENPLKHTNAR